MKKAESHADTDHMTKIANFEHSRWRTAAILKIVFFSIDHLSN